MMALKKEGVWSIVSSAVAALGEDNVKRVLECYSLRQNKALVTIILSINLSLSYLLRNPDNPAAVRRKLVEQFQKSCLNLRCKLHSLRSKDGELIQNQVKTMVETFNKLSIVGIVGDAITE